MADLKHVGKMKGSDERVVVPYRTIPGDSHSAVVISTAKISPEDHDAMMKVVESNAGQSKDRQYIKALCKSLHSSGLGIKKIIHVSIA